MKTTIILASLMFAGCVQPSPQDEGTATEPETWEDIDITNPIHPEIHVVDECEYIICREKKGTNTEYGYMAHKGNCNNPIHIYQTAGTVSDTLETTDTITE